MKQVAIFFAAAVCVAAGAITPTRSATASPPQEQLVPVAGAIFGADSSSLIVRTDDGKYFTMAISSGATIVRARPGTFADVRAGSTVYSNTDTDSKGNVTTQEILVLPTSDANNSGAVVPAWLKTPMKTLDEGVVQSTSSVSGAQVMSLSNVKSVGSDDQPQTAAQKNVVAASKAMITVISYADIAALTRNARVRALAAVGSDGSLSARLVEIDG